MLREFFDLVKGFKHTNIEPLGKIYSPMQMWKEATEDYREKPDKMNYSLLRKISKKDAVIGAIIRTRLNQIYPFWMPFAWSNQIGFRIRSREIKHQLTKVEEKEVLRLEKFIAYCSKDDVDYPKKQRFSEFLAEFVNDILVLDQVAIERIYSRKHELVGIRTLDGATVRIASKKLQDQGVDYVQVLDINNNKIEFTKEELAFVRMFCSSEIDTAGYGRSPIEDLIKIVIAHINTENKNIRRITPGAPPEGMLIQTGGSMSPEVVQAIQMAYSNQLAGMPGAHKLALISLGQGKDMKYIDFGKGLSDMEDARWTDYLINLACAVYAIDPAEINFPNRGGMGEKAPMFQSGEESRLVYSKDKGLRPLLGFISEILTVEVIDKLTKNQDFIFEFMGINKGDEEEKIRNDKEKSTYLMTVNELRKKEDLPNLPTGDIILNQMFITAMQMQQSQQNQMQMQQNDNNEEGEEGNSEEEVGNNEEEEELSPSELSDEDMGEETENVGTDEE
jgi:hypothetical protein